MTDAAGAPGVNTISSMMEQNGRLISAQAGMLEELVRLRAELADLNYHYECAVTDRDVANSELAEWVAQDERNLAELHEARRELKATQAGWLVEINKVARVRELCDARDRVNGPVFADYDETTDEIRAAIEGNQP